MVGGAISIAAPCTLLMSPFLEIRLNLKVYKIARENYLPALFLLLYLIGKTHVFFISFLGEAESEGAGSANIHHVSLATILMITSVYLF